MPDKPTYLHKLDTILAEARSPKPIPFFRRRDIEALFGLKKRQAVTLMHRIGAVRVSSELAIPQRDLVLWLEKLRSSPATEREARRYEKVIGRIIELKAETAARAIKIALPEGPLAAEIPAGVSLEPGLLSVSFEDGPQLLQKLFLLARAFAAKPYLLENLQASV